MFYNWIDFYPHLSYIKENKEQIIKELKNNKIWFPWPEKNLYIKSHYKWDIIPLLYTFPANNENRKTWIHDTCNLFPKTVEILKKLPNIKTALFSKMGPYTIIDSHQGWGELSNYVLRCHIPIYIPEKNKCGISVGGILKFHSNSEIICFDDSKIHNAFNFSHLERIVLILDFERPEGILHGKAPFGKTKELTNFMKIFN